MDARRSIPSVDRLLASEAFQSVLRQWPRALVTRMLQQELSAIRSAPVGGGDADGAGSVRDSVIAERVRHAIDDLAAPTLAPVINATGVVLHTNLGRAPLADVALNAMTAAARGYTNLEYDNDTGSRGSRYVHCRSLLCTLTGAEDALVVNNNAAALVLALNTVARGLDTVVSRGELVEIGGAFRVPEIVARSGARLKEVGATNRTHAADYHDAIDTSTGALLKVHPSNFSVSGYTAEASVRELGEIAAAADVPLIHDLGSGLLVEPATLGLPADEPVPQRSLDQGAAIITFSGDKLLGGPQCGIIVGRTELVERMRGNPLCRALRVDKLTIAALAATLRLYLEPARALREVPVLRMLTTDAATLHARAEALAVQCGGIGLTAGLQPGSSAVGGGAAPGASLPTTLLTLDAVSGSAAGIERRLRTGRPAVITRIVDGRVAIDLRTVGTHEEAALLRALRDAVSQ